MANIHIRPLNPSEWQLLREFRLAAVKATPGVFFKSYEEESTYPPEKWQENIQGHSHQVFGLFDDSKLIGITGVFPYLEEDPSGATAILGMSAILPEYRGKGFSKLLYQARLDWLRTKPQFKRVLVHHRASNKVSGEANKHFGFVRIGTALQRWPDGTEEEEIIYELKL